MFASRWRRLMSSNRSNVRRSRRNSWTVDIPVMCSCRNALIRATHARTVRYDSRTLRRNHCVTSDDQRQDGERYEREPPVHRDQHDHDAEQREDVAEDRHHARREHVVEHVDVGRHARHQPADRIAVVELQVDALQVARKSASACRT